MSEAERFAVVALLHELAVHLRVAAQGANVAVAGGELAVLANPKALTEMADKLIACADMVARPVAVPA